MRAPTTVTVSPGLSTRTETQPKRRKSGAGGRKAVGSRACLVSACRISKSNPRRPIARPSSTAHGKANLSVRGFLEHVSAIFTPGTGASTATRVTVKFLNTIYYQLHSSHMTVQAQRQRRWSEIHRSSQACSSTSLATFAGMPRPGLEVRMQYLHTTCSHR